MSDDGVKWPQRTRVVRECDCPQTAGCYGCPHCGRVIAAVSHINRCHRAALGEEPQ